jgi:hypothetical protein
MAKAWRTVLPGVVAFFLASPAGAQPRGVRLPGYQSAMSFDSGGVAAAIPASAGAVFFAARQIFSELGIPTPVADSIRGYLVNGRLVKARNLAGSPLSTYLHCGMGLTGPNADTFRVTMAVAAFMDSTSPSTSRFRIVLLAGAESTEGVSKSAVTCATSGVLENRIIQAVKLRVRPQYGAVR